MHTRCSLAVMDRKVPENRAKLTVVLVCKEKRQKTVCDIYKRISMLCINGRKVRRAKLVKNKISLAMGAVVQILSST